MHVVGFPHFYVIFVLLANCNHLPAILLFCRSDTEVILGLLNYVLRVNLLPCVTLTELICSAIVVVCFILMILLMLGLMAILSNKMYFI